jgi:hypothetical protein
MYQRLEENWEKAIKTIRKGITTKFIPYELCENIKWGYWLEGDILNYYLPFLFGIQPKHGEIVVDDVHITSFGDYNLLPLPPCHTRIRVCNTDLFKTHRKIGNLIVCHISFSDCAKEIKSKITHVR